MKSYTLIKRGKNKNIKQKKDELGKTTYLVLEKNYNLCVLKKKKIQGSVW